MPRITWLANEVRQAASCNSVPAAARAELLNAARAFEPLILESLVPRTTLTEIINGQMATADESLSEGRSLESQFDEKENEFRAPMNDWSIEEIVAFGNSHSQIGCIPSDSGDKISDKPRRDHGQIFVTNDPRMMTSPSP